jgi:hypothetical protein
MMDARVKDLQGENLGQLKDVIIDPVSGRATFAVIQLNGQVGTRGEYSPVPWALLKPSSAAGEPKSFVLNADRNKFASSQKFNLKSWPDYNEATWGPQVYSYYGLDASTLGAAVGGTGTATEMTPTSDSYRHDTRRPGTRANGTPIDNGTAPDGKGTFARGTRY